MSKTETSKEKVRPEHKAKVKVNHLQLPIGIQDPEEYFDWLLESISVLNTTFFAQRDIEMDEEDRNALYILNDFQKRMLRMRNKT